MAERATAERLLLVTRVGRWFHLREPVLIGAGQSYWIDAVAAELCVDRDNGQVTRHAGWTCR